MGAPPVPVAHAHTRIPANQFDDDDDDRDDDDDDADSAADGPVTEDKKLKAEIAMVNVLNLKNQLELYALNNLGLEIEQTTVKQMRKEIIDALKSKNKG